MSFEFKMVMALRLVFADFGDPENFKAFCIEVQQLSNKYGFTVIDGDVGLGMAIPKSNLTDVLGKDKIDFTKN